MTNPLTYLAAIPGRIWRKYFGEPIDPMNPLKPYFWYRQPWHILTGFLAGLASWGLSFWSPIASGTLGGLYFGLIIYMETEDKAEGQTPLKTLADLTFHALGFTLGTLL